MDVVNVLEYMQSQGLVRLNKIAGKYYSIYCPIHNNGNERRPSCGVLLHDEYRNGQKYPAGFTHCFTCGLAKPLSETVSEILKIHPVSEEVRRTLQNLIGSEVEQDTGKLISKELSEELIARYALTSLKSHLGKTQNYVQEEELQKYRIVIPYLYERKLTDDIIEKYDVGIDMNYVPAGHKKAVPCVTFPVRDKLGKTLFILRRAVPNKRFYMPSNIEKPVYGIYELPKDSKRVYIVESCFNALTCVRYGQPAVALLGTGTQYQITQLKQLGVREFVLGFDPDDAGRRATNKLKKALRDVAIVWSLEGIPETKDINDLSEFEFNSLQLI